MDGVEPAPGARRESLIPGERALSKDVWLRLELHYASTSRMAAPAPFRLATLISLHLRERITPSAPPRKAAKTASWVPPGVDFDEVAAVGISISMPGQSWVFAPARAVRARLASRYT